MKPKVKTVSQHFVSIDEVDYELRLKPEDDDIKVEKLPDGRAVLGYLLHDPDCDNPTESDCEGKIYSFSSRHTNCIDQEEAERLIEKYPLSVPLSYFEHGSCIWAPAGNLDSTPDFRWDGVRFAGLWVPEGDIADEIAIRAYKRFLPDTVAIDLSNKSLTDAYKQVVKELGIVINPEQFLLEQKKAAVELATQVCKSYTEWCNGECYGVIVVTCNPDGSSVESDETWGYVGREWAEKELADNMENTRKYLEREKGNQ